MAKKKQKQSMKFKMDEEFSYNNSLQYFAKAQKQTLYHAKTLGSEKQRVANDSRLPQTFQTMLDFENEGSTFLGYPFLQMLSQNALISAGVDTIADEMTKKFAQIIYTGDSAETETVLQNRESPEDKIKKLETLLTNFKIASLFRKAAEYIGYYGGCLVYIDNGADRDDAELMKSPLILDPATFKKDSLKNFILIDPINVTPGFYNTTDPTSKDYFKPKSWFVLGKEIHATRFLYFCGKEAPLLYKPSYNFFGVSTAQLVFEYVQNFLKNRDSASELLDKFSVSVFKTNMSEALQGKGTSSVDERIQYFVQKRHNDGVFAIDKDQEDFVKVETPLSGVTEIVRQALELIAVVFRLPAVKLLGISPSGFNATGESDLKNFNTFIESQQKKQFSDNLETVLNILQLHAFGQIDEYFSFEFHPLDEEDKKTQADVEKIKADTHAVYLDRNVISQEEVRKIISQDKNGQFKTIDPDNTDALADLESGEEDFAEGIKLQNEQTPENAF